MAGSGNAYYSHNIGSVPQPPSINEFDEALASFTSYPPLGIELGTSPFLGFSDVPYQQTAGFGSDSFFSGNEQSEMLSFLQEFDTSDAWEFNPLLPSRMPIYPGESIPEEQPTSDSHHDRIIVAESSPAASSSNGTAVIRESQTTPQPQRSPTNRPSSSVPLINSDYNSNADFRPKPLLSAPQKRMNHVRSEKRRRDTIRDGYLTLTKMLSPSAPGAEQLAIPRRGRPKGSGRPGLGGKKTGKGKSGVLFRAVEYIRYLEEGCDALETECARLEAMLIAGDPTTPVQNTLMQAYGNPHQNPL